MTNQEFQLFQLNMRILAYEHFLVSLTNTMLSVAIVGSFTIEQREALIKSHEERVQCLVQAVRNELALPQLTSAESDMRSAEFADALEEVTAKWLASYSKAMREGGQINGVS